MFPFGTKAETMSALLPVQIIGCLVTVKVTLLRSLHRIAGSEIGVHDANLRSTEADATRIGGRTLSGSWDAFFIFDLLIIETHVINEVLRKERSQTNLGVIIIAA